MTTPAVNIDDYFPLNSSQRRRTTRYDTGVVTSDVNDVRGTYYAEKRTRPASVAGSRHGGWTPPLPWSHSGYETVEGSGSFYCKESVYTSLPHRYVERWNDWKWAVANAPDSSVGFGGRGTFRGTTDALMKSQTVSRAELKALEKLKDMKVNLALALAEGGKTASMIQELVSTMSTMVRRFRRGDPRAWRAWRSGASLKKDIAARVLQFQYGIRPLMSDICGLIDAYADLSRRTTKRFYVIGKARDSYSLDVDWPMIAPCNTRNASIVGKVNRTIGVKVRLDYEVGNINSHTASSLGLTNGLEIAHELFPYSFLVDWIVPVGSWLSSLDAGNGFVFKGGSVSIIRRSEESLRYVLSPRTSSVVLDDLTNTIRPNTVKAFDFQRTVYSGTPIPGLYFKNPLSVEHAINSIALFVQLFAK